MDDLHKFLETVGLADSKLKLAKAKCTAAAIDRLSDLRDLYDEYGVEGVKEAFPLVIAKAVIKTLVASGSAEVATEEQTVDASTPGNKTSQDSESKEVAITLPPGKRFHTFCSVRISHQSDCVCIHKLFLPAQEDAFSLWR